MFEGLIPYLDQEPNPMAPKPMGPQPMGAPNPLPPDPKQPFYKDKDKMAMILATLSNGFGNMTLRGNRGLSQVNNAIIGRAMENRKNNKTIAMLEKTNPKLAELAKKYPGYVGEIAKLGISQEFKESPQQWAIIPSDQNEAYNLPPNKPFRVNLTTGKVEAIGGGGTTVNVNERLPTPPAGYENVTDDEGRLVSQRMIPGGPADLEAQALKEKGKNRGRTKANAASTVVSDIERSIELVKNGNASDIFGDAADGIPVIGPIVDVIEGATAVGLSKIPGGRTDANKALQLSESARSNIGIDSLQTMRENSPTGGALGQVPFQQQQRLEQLYGQLNPVEMTPEEYEFNANRVINLYSDIIYGSAAERAELVATGKITEEQNREIESRYKPLTRDSSGRPFDISRPPPDFDLSQQQWQQASDDVKMRAWNRYERNQVPDWYSL